MKSKNVRRTLLSLLVVALMGSVFGSGCYDRIELEGMAFVVALGLDKGPNNTIDVTVRIAIPSEMGSGNDGGAGGTQLGASRPMTVRSNTVAGALTLLNSTVERRISLLHLTTIYIGENVAKEGVLNFLGPLVRMRDFRRTVNFFIVPGEAREVFQANQPVLEKSSSRFNESISEIGRHTGLTVTNKLHDFLITTEGSNEDPIAPVIAINRNVQQQAEEAKSQGQGGQAGQGKQKGTRENTMPDAKVSFKPGEVVRMGGNSVEFIGSAIFNRDKLVTYLDGIQTRVLLMIRGELQRTQMDFPDPQQKGKFEAIEIKHARSPQMEVDVKSNPITIKIKQKLEGDLVGVQSTIDYTEESNMRVLEDSIKKTLKQKEEDLVNQMFHEYQVAPFGVFRQARAQFLTEQEMEAFKFRDKLKNAKVSIDVDLNIRRIGVQLAPVQAK
ncbi:Ger(x)C family spore germination protein [Tumebacillus sp. ITR2]|uniref:Ger(X)C family spore germination protein n=1 Tax=Tumebacillus amylolyticus TaxID=2801339 RepID=A0ABS1JER4_9BACL|nr:Ger(x)C family spore germination protein [Tumebacillus amylolyticus]MBL0388780.1 Ger(x)C family spore germination protein [Tumebacillus amylolyticus]